jgi:AcrR family transcriptional regulator
MTAATSGKDMTPTSGQPPRPPAEPGKAPRRRERRKDARPGEIVDAALRLFGERGYGATRIEDVARLAGVAKGTVLVYFASKEDLFRAVARAVLATHLGHLDHIALDPDRRLAETVPLLLARAARAGQGGLPPVARLIVAEARAFPDLARVWHDEVASKVLGALTAAIERAQARGEVRPGDARLHAFSIIGPMMAAMLFREVFGPTGAPVPDLEQLALEHARTAIRGLALSPE